MWFIGVEVEQETSAPPPKKILDPPLLLLRGEKVFSFRNSVLMHFVNLNLSLHSPLVKKVKK